MLALAHLANPLAAWADPCEIRARWDGADKVRPMVFCLFHASSSKSQDQIRSIQASVHYLSALI